MKKINSMYRNLETNLFSILWFFFAALKSILLGTIGIAQKVIEELQ